MMTPKSLLSGTAVTLALVGTMGATPAAANITYNVNRTVGNGSVVGTIVTDGTFGALSDSNILDWQFTLTSPEFLVFTGTPNGSSATRIIQKSNQASNTRSSSLLTATANNLFFDFSGTAPAGDVAFFSSAATVQYEPVFGFNRYSWCLSGVGQFCFGDSDLTPNIEMVAHSSLGFGEFVSRSSLGRNGNTIIARAAGSVDEVPVSAIPEPETYAMLLVGLGLLGFAARRKKQAQAAGTCVS